MTKNANYRKNNDRTHNSSTYHKKDGTPIRHLLKQEAKKEIEETYRIQYNERLQQFKNGEITEEQWKEFCSYCLGKIMEENQDVLVRLKNRR